MKKTAAIMLSAAAVFTFAGGAEAAVPASCFIDDTHTTWNLDDPNTGGLNKVGTLEEYRSVGCGQVWARANLTNPSTGYMKLVIETVRPGTDGLASAVRPSGTSGWIQAGSLPFSGTFSYTNGNYYIAKVVKSNGQQYNSYN